MDISPVNVTMMVCGGILLYAAKDNRSPVNVVKSALGLEEARKLPGVDLGLNLGDLGPKDFNKPLPDDATRDDALKRQGLQPGGGFLSTNYRQPYVNPSKPGNASV